MKLFNHSVIRLFSYSLILFFSACMNRSTVIEGELPNDDYDKQAVFWVPMEGDHPKPVDSTHIDKNRFRLAISKHNLNKMGIIRVRPEFRLGLQDILVFTESGTVLVKLDTISSASGTPLNQILQQWKDKKQAYNKRYYSLRRKYSKEDSEPGKEQLQSELLEMKKEYRTFTDSLVNRNKDNAVGQFIRSLENPDK